MEQDNKIMITIPLDEYRTLIQDSEDFDIMKGILFQNAKLNYNGKELRFDDECLNEFLRFTDSRYKNILAELQEAKRMEEEKILKESEDHKNE